MKSIPKNRIQLISKHKIQFANKQPFLLFPVLIISLLYLLYILNIIRNQLNYTLLEPKLLNIFPFFLFIIFTLLLIGATLIGNELGKKVGTSIAKPSINQLYIGLIFIITAFISSYILNSSILAKYQDPENLINFQQLIFPGLFHWLLLMMIFYSGISIALTYHNLEIDKNREEITLFRKLKLTEKAHLFNISFNSFKGFIITGPGNQTITKSRLSYLQIFTRNEKGIQRVMIGNRDYLIGIDRNIIIKIIFDLHKLNKFEWMITTDNGLHLLDQDFFENSNENNFLTNVKMLIQ